jgi:hypothetical protein
MVSECRDQSRNCIYTSTSFFIWLRFLRTVGLVLTVVPLILGSLASWKLLTQSDLDSIKLVIAALAFFAGIIPTISRALRLDRRITQCRELAAEFKNLQDEFRQCANISSLKPFSEFDADFRRAMKRLEQARKPSYTPPEWCFKRAQRKVQSGDYDPDPQPKQ